MLLLSKNLSSQTIPALTHNWHIQQTQGISTMLSTSYIKYSKHEAEMGAEFI